MVAEFQRLDPLPSVVTVYALSPETVHNPNVVKTLLAHDGRALYFSRSAIPHVRDVDPLDWHRHHLLGPCGDVRLPRRCAGGLGSAAPFTFGGSGTARAAAPVEAGHTMATFRVEGTSLSVDTAEQLEQARAMV